MKCLSKKILIVAIATISSLLFCFVLCACGQQNSETPSEKKETPKTNDEIYKNVINELSIVTCIGANSMVTNYPTNYQETYDKYCSYVPRLNERPIKYTFTDLNDDGADEMVVSGENLFLSIYSYDPKSYEISFLKDMYDDEVKKGHIVTKPDTLREGGIIYHTYIHGNNTHYQMLQCKDGELTLLDEVNENIGNIVGSLVNGDSEYTRESYDAKIAKLEETYPVKEGLEWHNIEAKTLIPLYGTVKVQSIKERLDDTSYTNPLLDSLRGALSSAVTNENEVHIVLDLDGTQIVPMQGEEGLYLDAPSSLHICAKNSTDPESQALYEEYSKLNGEKVYILVDSSKLDGINGINPFACDAIPSKGCIIKYSKNLEDLENSESSNK